MRARHGATSWHKGIQLGRPQLARSSAAPSQLWSTVVPWSAGRRAGRAGHPSHTVLPTAQRIPTPEAICCTPALVIRVVPAGNDIPGRIQRLGLILGASTEVPDGPRVGSSSGSVTLLRSRCPFFSSPYLTSAPRVASAPFLGLSRGRGHQGARPLQL